MHITDPEDDPNMTELLCHLQRRGADLGLDDKAINMAEDFMLESHRAGQRLVLGRAAAPRKTRKNATTAG